MRTLLDPRAAATNAATGNNRHPLNRDLLETAWLIVATNPGTPTIRLATVTDLPAHGFANRAEALRYLHAADLLAAAGLAP